MIKEYDDTKKMLKVIREHKDKHMSLLREQYEQKKGDDENFLHINDTDIKILSSDSLDLELNEDEKDKTSQMIDDFKDQIPNLIKIHEITISVPNSVKMLAEIPNMKFMFSAGEEGQGVYITNVSLFGLTKQNMAILTNLKNFSNKFSTWGSELLYKRNNN